MADTDSTLEVQKAVVAALRGDAAVSALVGARVYDRTPQDVAFPHVRIVSTIGQPAVETDSGEGFEALMTLHIWSRSPAGSVEALQIAAAVVDLLNNSELSLDSKTVVMTRLADQRSRHVDDVTAQVIQNWRFLTDG